MDQEGVLWALLERPEPEEKFFSIGVIAELLQRRYLGANGNRFRENTHRSRSALDDLTTRARRLEANEEHLVARIGQPQQQMVQYAAARDHSAGRDDDAGIAHLIDLF